MTEAFSIASMAAQLQNQSFVSSRHTTRMKSAQLTDGRMWKFITRICWVAPTFGLAVFGALLGVIWYGQEKLLFYPKVPPGCDTPDKNDVPYQNPSQLGMPYENVYVKTIDNIKIHGWLMKQPGNAALVRPTVIFLQGNAGNIGQRMPIFSMLYRQCHFNVFALSYRGYGFSEGSPTEEGVFFDAIAALGHLRGRKDIDPSKIIVFGRSVGGAIAVEVAVKCPYDVAAIIVENTFTSILDMALVVYPLLRVLAPVLHWFQRLKMDSISKIPELSVPALFISGLADQLVPPQQMKRLFDKAEKCPLKKFYGVPDGDHNTTWQVAGPEYCKRLLNFAEEALALERTRIGFSTLSRATTLTDGTCEKVL